MTLACDDGNPKIVEVVTVAYVDAEDHVDNSLLQVGQDFEVEVQARF